MLDPRKENLDPSSQPRLKICSKMVYEHGLLCLLSLPSPEAQDEDDCDDINGVQESRWHHVYLDLDTYCEKARKNIKETACPGLPRVSQGCPA